MISFKAHSALKQYIKSKPHKWGLKVFARAEFGDIVYEYKYNYATEKDNNIIAMK
jgi:hypothetical protein